jgi:hypothetical protein
MAISFSCTCGKQLRARAEFAGRKIRCPGCQSVVTIPTTAPAPIPLTADDEPVPFAASTPSADDIPAPVPLAAPVAVKVPDTLIPSARPARDVTAKPVSAVSKVPLLNPWIDRSLEQTATPWRAEDQERFRQITEPRRGGYGAIVIALLLVALVAFAVLFA